MYICLATCPLSYNLIRLWAVDGCRPFEVYVGFRILTLRGAFYRVLAFCWA